MLTRMWRWIADVALPATAYTGHLHQQRGDHALWHTERDGEPLEPFDR